MPGAERHSGARKWRACSHRAPKKQAKGDGRAAKGQHDHYGTCSWPMEKNMDQYGNVAAERNCARPEASGIRQQAAPGSVAASALAHGLLQLPGSKRGSVGAPRLMAACKVCYRAVQQQAVVKMVVAPKPRKPSCRCRGAAVVKLVSVSEPRKPSCGSKAARPCLW
ncbi:hypothetical protein PR002_g28420 [Phytophthora rubi]|uniref:Uncharacterized protein n=1 Tax=Phytophthora rubi TaxID=129364 RepID=A0A6A3HAU3_9STRA|nr:hypothetical protein PR002_g28420 [Phytophthora rubi]